LSDSAIAFSAVEAAISRTAWSKSSRSAQLTCRRVEATCSSDRTWMNTRFNSHPFSESEAQQLTFSEGQQFEDVSTVSSLSDIRERPDTLLQQVSISTCTPKEMVR